MEYTRLYLYCFSGTGNARTCARWIAEESSRRGVECILYELGHTESPAPLPEAGSLVGFLSPTHGFHFPGIMRQFIRRFPGIKNGSAFVMNTRAGVRIGRVFLPGLSGLVHYLSAFILWLKGYRISGLCPADLPSNWLSLHPAVRKTGAKMMYRRMEPKVKRFAGIMLDGGRNYRALRSFPFDAAISPIAIAYMLVGRFFLAKTFYATSACDHCMLCLHSCPVKAIRIVNGRMFWSWRCESCMKCMNICPRKAIETGHGFLALVIWISTMAFGTLTSWLLLRSGAENLPWLEIGAIRFLLVSVVMVVLIFAGYRLMHFLLRFRIFERPMAWTSLTWWSFWGRYNFKNNDKQS